MSRDGGKRILIIFVLAIPFATYEPCVLKPMYIYPVYKILSKGLMSSFISLKFEIYFKGGIASAITGSLYLNATKNLSMSK